MYVMRGRMPVRVMAHHVREKWMKPFIRLFGGVLIRPEPYGENYFLDDALRVRGNVGLPLIYVGGIVSAEGIETVLSNGFEFVQIGRALINDPAFINKLRTGEVTRSGCNHANYCIAVMYSGEMACYQHREGLPEKWLKELDRQK